MYNSKKLRKAFTLLELLVVMAILAAVAGTASIALKDTDARAAAAAHVAMMDQLNKGIRSYRVLQKNTLPTRFDGLLTTTFADPGVLGFTIADDAAIAVIPTGVLQIMLDGGIDALMYIDNTSASDPADAGDCSDLNALINSRGNAVVAGNIFLPAVANGCGTALPFDADADGEADATLSGVFWIGGTTRLTGQDNPSGTDVYDADDNYVYLITGIGPASTLFDANTLGGMTTVPVYRHVAADEYGRFMAVWNVGTYGGGDGSIIAGDQCELVAIVDGALDTKEEELGEWDGTRNTI